MSRSDVVIKDALLQNVSDPWVRKEISTNSNPHSSEHIQTSAAVEAVDISYLYPILQQKLEDPPRSTTIEPPKDNQTKSQQPQQQKQKKKKSNNYVPWSQSPAIIKFSFHGDNPLSTFLDNAWGSVHIPIRELVEEEYHNDHIEDVPGVQPEVRIWKDIVWTSAQLQVRSSLRLLYL